MQNASKYFILGVVLVPALDCGAEPPPPSGVDAAQSSLASSAIQLDASSTGITVTATALNTRRATLSDLSVTFFSVGDVLRERGRRHVLAAE